MSAMSDEMRQRLAAHREWVESDGARGTLLDARDADLRFANLRDANLFGVDLTGARLSGADLTLSAPVVPRLASAILDAIGPAGEHLDMGWWHTCETVHCVAGWTVVLAGNAGAALERTYGTPTAAAFIWAASTGLPVPDYYCTGEAAIAALRIAAAEEREGCDE